MPKEYDIQYAMEHSHVLREPDHRIDTFGNTRFHFVIISEMMDEVDKVIIRRGSVEAYKPKIIKPAHYSSVELEGFDDKAKKLLEWLKSNDKEPVFFQYGFNFKRTEVNTENMTGKYDVVKAELLDKVRDEDDPMMAVMELSLIHI